MAYIYKGLNGKKLEEFIAGLPVVQSELEDRAFEIGVRAEASLIEHKQDGHARIEITEGDIDKYVVLDDSRGMDAAMSIEFGRAGFIDPDTGLVYDRMEPLFILTNAARLPRRGSAMRAPKVRPLSPTRRRALLRKFNRKG